MSSMEWKLLWVGILGLDGAIYIENDLQLSLLSLSAFKEIHWKLAQPKYEMN